MSRLFKKAMDPISSETHFVAACFSLVGLFIIFGLGAYKGTPLSLMGAVIVFGLSQIALYSASSLYHYYQGSEKIKFILRKLDHAMIYVLIVGTYTPIIVYCMEAPKSYYFLGVLWALAIVGILVKVFWMNAPRILGTSIYLILGWSILFDFNAFSGISVPCLSLIALGGIMYSIGAIIYMIKKPNWSERFGFHELFHLFVMAGSFCHYLAIIIFIL